MPRLQIDGVGLHYEDEGKGDPVLLLHGALGTGRRHFRRQIEVLAGRYRVIVPDTYGYGESDRRPEFPASFYYDDAAQLARLVTGLGIRRRAQIGGFSDGACLALCLALDFPELVNSLVLFGASSYIDAPMLDELNKLTPESLPAGFQAALARAHGEATWRDVVRIWLEGQQAILRQGGEISRARLSEIRCPVRLVHGGADPVIPVQQAEIIQAAIAGAELIVLAERGHAVLQEAPDETSRLLREFFDCHPLVSSETA